MYRIWGWIYQCFFLAAIILHNWSTVSQFNLVRILTWIGPTGCNTLIFTWHFCWNKPCPMEKPYPQPPLLWGGCLLLVIWFKMVLIVGMIALVIIFMITIISVLDWYDFGLNKGNVFIFQVISEWFK